MWRMPSPVRGMLNCRPRIFPMSSGVGLITPPVGMNVFVINKLARDVPMRHTFRGVVPFLISDAVRVALLLIFPVLTYGLLELVKW